MKSFGAIEHTGHYGLTHTAYACMAETVLTASFFAKVLVDKGKAH
jgi:hypothetical protein